MGRGGAIYLSYTALVLLCAVSRASAGLWDVSIDNGPAPSPEDGPPFSAHATRDRALLPYQIIGIVASYLGTILIAGTLLLTVGRRLRKHALTMADKPTEMIKPMARAFDASVKSPVSQRSLRSIFKSKNGSVRSKTSEIGSPGGMSVASFDQEAVKQHQQRLNDDMANIYGQVYAYDEQKSPQRVTTLETQPASPQYRRASGGRNALQRVQSTDSYPHSPTTPLSPSYQAIYPPAELRTLPQYPLSPTRGNYTAPPLSPGQPRSPIRASRTSSLGSNRSSPNKARKALNKLEISLPIQKRKDDDNSDGARTPLSPRFYTDSGVPPEPPTARTMDSEYPPTTPGTGRTIPYPEEYGYEEEERDEVRPFPPQSPQRAVHYNNLPQIITDVASSRPDPTSSGTPNSRRGNGSATNVGGTLAFRAQREQNRAYQYPMSPGRYPQSAGPTKTTFVEARREFLGMPLTATGKEPYSPYMLRYDAPTPVTPHMLTRDERKQREKEERAARGAAIEEEDLVADDKDLWSSGY